MLCMIWSSDMLINENTLLEVCESLGLNSGDLFKESEKAQDKYNSLAEKASIKNVFGSPSYILNSEVFWGQDRLDLLEEAILRNISNESK